MALPLIHNFFSLGVAQPSPKAPRFHRGISGDTGGGGGWDNRPGEARLLGAARARALPELLVLPCHNQIAGPGAILDKRGPLRR